MIGSIIGDIAGSIYEFNNIKTKDFPLFGKNANYTDDSVLTFATADWILSGGDVANYYLRYGIDNPCPMGGFGGGFRHWLQLGLNECEPAPAYGSCGNGSAMRIGPVGWAYDTEEETLAKAEESSACTHDHPEGIIGAQAVALCIFMARNGKSKEEIRKAIEAKFCYDLSDSVETLQKEYGWHSKWGNGGLCQASVPQAIVCFLEGENFEDCIRNAISIGGDSDTIGCITGSMAEAFYGVPEAMRTKAMSYLSMDLYDLVNTFEEKYGRKVEEIK